jgi:hypothetical protein
MKISMPITIAYRGIEKIRNQVSLEYMCFS